MGRFTSRASTVLLTAMLGAACGPAASAGSAADGVTSDASTDGGTEDGSTGEEVDCSDYLDQPEGTGSVAITIRNDRGERIGVRAPSCSADAFSVEGPDDSTFPFLAFEFSCETNIEHGVCHPYAAPDGCPPWIVAVLEPGETLETEWSTTMYHVRDLAEACRGLTEFGVEPCLQCKQRGAALPGPSRARRRRLVGPRL